MKRTSVIKKDRNNPCCRRYIGDTVSDDVGVYLVVYNGEMVAVAKRLIRHIMTG